MGSDMTCPFNLGVLHKFCFIRISEKCASSVQQTQGPHFWAADIGGRGTYALTFSGWVPTSLPNFNFNCQGTMATEAPLYLDLLSHTLVKLGTFLGVPSNFVN